MTDSGDDDAAAAAARRGPRPARPCRPPSSSVGTRAPRSRADVPTPALPLSSTRAQDAGLGSHPRRRARRARPVPRPGLRRRPRRAWPRSSRSAWTAPPTTTSTSDARAASQGRQRDARRERVWIRGAGASPLSPCRNHEPVGAGARQARETRRVRLPLTVALGPPTGARYSNRAGPDHGLSGRGDRARLGICATACRPGWCRRWTPWCSHLLAVAD